eukprot:13835403-Heterocapsa_arctica.AAC.1
MRAYVVFGAGMYILVRSPFSFRDLPVLTPCEAHCVNKCLTKNRSVVWRGAAPTELKYMRHRVHFRSG